MPEQWKPVAGFEDYYAVSNLGRVFSFRKKRLMRSRLKANAAGMRYPIVEFHDRSRPTVHSLVLTAFRGPCPAGQQCRHLDSNPQNNVLTNLEWGTYRENREDYYEYNLGGYVKLTPELVRYIYASQKTLRALARELGCSKTLIGQIRQRINWKHVEISGPTDYPEYWTARREHAGWLRQQGHTFREIAGFLGIQGKKTVATMVHNRFPKRGRQS